MNPELLAPAGSPEALRAAVQAGADAVYLGLGPLNARRNAKNFTPGDLPDQVAYCHRRGVKVYLTLNTLAADRELPQAAETAALAARAGVDAVLVQDLGVARLLRETCPDLPLHASTQMTVHDLDGVRACADLGMERVVLARELPAEAIEHICAHSPIEIEVFAHGALCMCYSGQCFLSAVLGGRSGNRGLCAQPCRLAYRWPGEKETSHPLSLKDLSLEGRLARLRDMGVACLKLEGRMKRPEYVWVVTSLYAAALREDRPLTREERAMLEAAFSRQGFTRGYFDDKTGPEMFGWRREGTRDPEDLFARAREQYSRGEHRLTPVFFSARMTENAPFTLTVRDDTGRTVTARGPVPEIARSRPLTEDRIAAQLEKTGGTVYRAEKTEVTAGPGLTLPLSALNALRREVLEGLDKLRETPPPRRVLPFTPPEQTGGRRGRPDFSLVLRRWSQLSPACLDLGPALVFLPAEEAADYSEALKELTAAYPHIAFGAVLPRVCFDRERPDLENALEKAKEAGITQALLGHVGQLPLARRFGLTPRGDFGLGYCNSLTGRELARLGFASAAVSFEARFSQLRDLDKPLDLAVTVYGRLPLMITENCILRNRGRGCLCREEPQSLTDRKGEAFPVERAWGCRNELFNARVLWLADKPGDWTGLGARYARLSFLREGPEECVRVLAAYQGKADPAPPAAFTRGLYYRGVE